MTRGSPRVLGSRVVRALRSWPGARGWTHCALLFALFVALALPVAHGADLLDPGWRPASARHALALFAGAAVAPALGEELLFRVLPLPHPSESAGVARRALWSVAALAAFVAWHPLNAWLLRPAARALFYDPAFLSLAGLLGLTCTLAYLRTGSIWPPLLFHWLVVALWGLWLGAGIEALG